MSTVDAELDVAQTPAAADGLELTDAREARVGGMAVRRLLPLRPGQLLYLAAGREQVRLSAPAGSRLLLLGGVPLGERLLMWWNFVARTPEEIEAAAADWREGRFAPVADYDGEPLPAPPLDAVRLRRPR